MDILIDIDECHLCWASPHSVIPFMLNKGKTSIVVGFRRLPARGHFVVMVFSFLIVLVVPGLNTFVKTH